MLRDEETRAVTAGADVPPFGQILQRHHREGAQQRTAHPFLSEAPTRCRHDRGACGCQQSVEQLDACRDAFCIVLMALIRVTMTIEQPEGLGEALQAVQEISVWF
jgi:hypothetical protein